MGPIEPYLAYLDPGTGSMILQVVIAGLLTASVAFRGLFYSVFSFFGRLVSTRSNEVDSAQTESKIVK